MTATPETAIGYGRVEAGGAVLECLVWQWQGEDMNGCSFASGSGWTDYQPADNTEGLRYLGNLVDALPSDVEAETTRLFR